MRTVKVKSKSTPGKTHAVAINDAGQPVRCDCEGYRYGGNCWHIEHCRAIAWPLTNDKLTTERRGRAFRVLN